MSMPDPAMLLVALAAVLLISCPGRRLAGLAAELYRACYARLTVTALKLLRDGLRGYGLV